MLRTYAFKNLSRLRLGNGKSFLEEIKLVTPPCSPTELGLR
jgi:hypothetical protein